jgi:outer membrane receptor protein involved in Fe transport
LNWLIGAFYRNFDEEGGADLTNSGGTALFVKEATRDQWEIAGFADATYDITSALHANVGVRIYKGRQRRFDFDRGLFVGGSRTTAGDSRYDGINPRLSLSYDVNDDVMLYATAAKGYRAGGPNTPIPVPRCAADLATLGLTQGPAGFGPDSLWNYEVGARTSLANRRLTINGAAYVIKWRDIQLRQPLPTCGFDFGTNAGAATSTGVEVELTAHPAHNLELTASLGYADAQLDETLPGIPGSRAGARVPYVPKWTFGASASYTIPVTSSLSARLDSNYQFTSRYRTNLLAPSVRNRADPVNTWNASVTAVGRHWEAGVFVDNILDDRPVVGSNGSSAVIQYTVPRPRTIGLRVTGNF